MRLLIGRYAKPIHGCHISPSCSLSISFSSNKRSLHLLLRQVKIPRKSVRIAAKQGRVLIRIMLVSEPSHLHVMESWSKEFHRFITKGHASHHWPSACPRIGLLAILWRPSKQPHHAQPSLCHICLFMYQECHCAKVYSKSCRFCCPCAQFGR